jgi:hypothetical protein
MVEEADQSKSKSGFDRFETGFAETLVDKDVYPRLIGHLESRIGTTLC